MQTEYFDAQNVKCNGCVATIQKNLAALPGVNTVQVTLTREPGYNVTVIGENLLRETITQRLTELGYPVFKVN